MAVENKNIKWHGSQTMPDSDTPTDIGGAIDKSTSVTFADLENTGACKVMSENANDDSQTVTVYGRNTAGEKVNEGIALDGTTPQTGSTSFERLLKGVKSSSTLGHVAIMSTTNDHTGTATDGTSDNITLAAGASGTDDEYQFKVIRITTGTGAGQLREIVKYDGTTKIAYVRDWSTTPDATSQYEIADGMMFEKTPDEIMECRRIFYDASANPAGGATKIYYEKIFAYNQHATLALTNATIAEVAGGVATSVAFDLEGSLNGSDSNGPGNDRQTEGDLSSYTFDSTTKNVANSQNFSPQTGQGIWLELTLPGGAAATNSFYKQQVQGQSV